MFYLGIFELSTYPPLALIIRVTGLPVLVFIHGESWSWGSSHLYDGRILATLGQIIVVTFNYRIGVLGRPDKSTINTLNSHYNYFRFLEHQPLPHDEGSRGQLRPGGPDGGPAVGGGGHRPVWWRPQQDHTDGAGGGGSMRGVPGPLSHDQAVALPEGDLDVGEHFLWVGESG